mmetsp:Transcript_1787/g.4143  ORF Transcript_1787/g.4143 Transcript_1787/m.4143 type:complete len:258 (+) Transcript_1787:369-1142(+)
MSLGKWSILTSFWVADFVADASFGSVPTLSAQDLRLRCVSPLARELRDRDRTCRPFWSVPRRRDADSTPRPSGCLTRSALSAWSPLRGTLRPSLLPSRSWSRSSRRPSRARGALFGLFSCVDAAFRGGAGIASAAASATSAASCRLRSLLFLALDRSSFRSSTRHLLDALTFRGLSASRARFAQWTSFSASARGRLEVPPALGFAGAFALFFALAFVDLTLQRPPLLALAPALLLLLLLLLPSSLSTVASSSPPLAS